MKTLIYTAMAVDGLHTLLSNSLSRDGNFAELVDKYAETIYGYIKGGELKGANVDRSEFLQAARRCTDLWANGKPAEDNYTIFYRMVSALREELSKEMKQL